MSWSPTGTFSTLRILYTKSPHCDSLSAGGSWLRKWDFIPNGMGLNPGCILKSELALTQHCHAVQYMGLFTSPTWTRIKGNPLKERGLQSGTPGKASQLWESGALEPPRRGLKQAINKAVPTPDSTSALPHHTARHCVFSKCAEGRPAEHLSELVRSRWNIHRK